MLETTLADEFVPGSNRHGEVGAAAWRLLLPRLELDRVLWLGDPPAGAATPFERGGAQIDAASAPPFPAATYDLVVAADARGRRLLRRAAADGSLERLLAPDGRVYVEYSGLFGPPVLPGLGDPSVLRAWPAGGELRQAVPAADRDAGAFLRSLRAASVPAQGRLRAQARRLRRPALPARRLPARRAALVSRNGSTGSAAPWYIRALAADAGIAIDDLRWAFAAPGDYASRKALFFLLDRDTGRPRHIVKLTRDPRFNPRLENEWLALRALERRGLADGVTIPRPLFFGCHGGLAALGQTAVEGVPFRQRTSASAACPYARGAIDVLLGLADATVDEDGAPAGAAQAALGEILARFLAVYRLDPGTAAFLRAAVGRVDRLPTVVQHGDPGTWNALVTPGGRVAFLDWEAAEQRGVPLWDLWYFLRSFAVGAARRNGTRDALAGFAGQCLEETELAHLLVETTADACARAGVARELVEPLFYACWMHRALKEARRLAPGRLDDGHYVRLLRLCVERRDTPVLRRLFGAPA